jgi:hypothetical protein
MFDAEYYLNVLCCERPYKYKFLHIIDRNDYLLINNTSRAKIDVTSVLEKFSNVDVSILCGFRLLQTVLSKSDLND